MYLDTFHPCRGGGESMSPNLPLFSPDRAIDAEVFNIKVGVNVAVVYFFLRFLPVE